MNEWSAITKISSLLSLLALIVYAILKFYSKNRSRALDTSIINILVSTGVDPSQIDKLDNKTIAKLLKAKGTNTEMVLKFLAQSEIKSKERIILYFSILLIIIAFIGAYFGKNDNTSKTSPSIRKLIGSVTTGGVPLENVRVQMSKINKQDYTNKKGEFTISLEDSSDTSTFYNLRFTFEQISNNTQLTADSVVSWHINETQQIDLSIKRKPTLTISTKNNNLKTTPSVSISETPADVHGIITDKYLTGLSNAKIYFENKIIATTGPGGTFSFKINHVNGDDLLLSIEWNNQMVTKKVGRIQQDVNIMIP